MAHGMGGLITDFSLASERAQDILVHPHSTSFTFKPSKPQMTDHK